MRILGCLVFLSISIGVVAKDPYPRNEAIDILHYRFQLEFSDSSDTITGEATITVGIVKSVSTFELDLMERNSNHTGMKISQLSILGKAQPYDHRNGRLRITLPEPLPAGSTLIVTIQYSGIPTDGLIIGKNRFGERTFFGDNWPDRAHHWLPVVDHPSDKATCEFIVLAPEGYQVIANGEKIEESSLSNHRKLTHWSESAPIATKVMVVGVARFAVQRSGVAHNIPVESWIYPQDRNAGFADYSGAANMLEFFYEHVGPYSYEKLANVQSTTRYGGMENASAIFYAENSVTGKNQFEATVAHEVAHQWFGNSASEKDWHHVWLSEGFATYFSHLYMEFKYGREVFKRGMEVDRATVIEYDRSDKSPVIDTTVTVLMKLLNTHSYQKASWVLHMLRNEIGNEAFWKGIQAYYRAYKDSNALTDDFRMIMEDASGRDLRKFFDQWLWSGGHPVLSGTWKFNAAQKTVDITLQQNQPDKIYDVGLQIALQDRSGSEVVRSVRLNAKTQKFTLPAEEKPTAAFLDPNVTLLFEGNIKPL